MTVRAPGPLCIEARGVEKSYGGAFGRAERRALAGLTLEVQSGSAFGLIGVNGAGKTTFVKALLGVVLPSAGELRVLGAAPASAALHERIGYVPERLALPPAWTARAYLKSVARLKRLPRAELEIQRQLGRVGLAADAERRIGAFSKGMRQRLALATALLGSPELLILDEPTDGVDPIGRADIRRVLQEERERGATLFLNSHLLSETERMCDVIGILSHGRMLRSGSVKALCGAPGAWRLRFEPGTAESLPAPAFEACADGCHRVQAKTPTDLDRLLVEARAAGALLIELVADTRDLEQVLAEAMSAEVSAEVSADRSAQAPPPATPRAARAERGASGAGSA